MKPIGKMLSEIRTSEGLTQQQLGDRLGVSRQTIAAWEQGAIPERAVEHICEFVSQAYFCQQAAKFSAQAKYEVLQYEVGVKMTQLRSIIDEVKP